MRVKNRLLVSGLFALLIYSAVATFFTLKIYNYFNPNSNQQHTNFLSRPTPLPTAPPPFYELTIPHLRERNYSSQLSELNLESENANYNSYLTSYNSDGLKINGLLTIPKGDQPEGGWPAIVFVHGYVPPAQYNTRTRYNDYVNYLARNNFVVFKIDLRGHGTSEGEAGGAYYSANYIIDTLNARSALQHADFVNQDKVGFWGHSMAGNVVLRSAVVAQDVPAVSIWAGAVYTYDDWEKYGLNDNSYQPPQDDSDRQQRRNELFTTHGRYDSASNFWQMVVPTNYLDGYDGSIQLNHAVNDPVVDIGYSRDFALLLEEKGVDHELNEYQSGDHNITGPAFSQAMQNTVRFFKDNL